MPNTNTPELFKGSIAVAGGTFDALARRAEKISAAIVLVTKEISAAEEMRTRARSLALEMVRKVHALDAAANAEVEAEVRRLQSTAKELGTVVRLMAVGEMLAAQNASVLFSALQDFAVRAGSLPRADVKAILDLTDEVLEVPAPAAPVAPVMPEAATTVAPAAVQAAPVASVEKPEPVVQSREAQRPVHTPAPTQKKPVTTPKPVAKRPAPAVISNTQRGLSGRSETILKVLAGGDLFGISEIGNLLPEYSPKTIQRELLALVGSGKVEKIGEKRWSQYRRA